MNASVNRLYSMYHITTYNLFDLIYVHMQSGVPFHIAAYCYRHIPCVLVWFWMFILTEPRAPRKTNTAILQHIHIYTVLYVFALAGKGLFHQDSNCVSNFTNNGLGFIIRYKNYIAMAFHTCTDITAVAAYTQKLCDDQIHNIQVIPM